MTKNELFKAILKVRLTQLSSILSILKFILIPSLPFGQQIV